MMWEMGIVVVIVLMGILCVGGLCFGFGCFCMDVLKLMKF